MSRENEPPYETRPSWGLVGFTRRSIGGAGAQLFGSDLGHHTTMVLMVKRASMKRDLHREWYHADQQIVEIELSEMQFATLLTSMNVGEGVPCTILWEKGIGRIRHEAPSRSQRELMDSELQDACDESITRTDDLVDAIRTTKMAERDRKELLRLVDRVRQQVSSNMPFLSRSFSEVVDKKVAEGKAAIEGFWTSAIHKMGLDTARTLAGRELTMPVSLPAYEPTKPENTDTAAPTAAEGEHDR